MMKLKEYNISEERLDKLMESVEIELILNGLTLASLHLNPFYGRKKKIDRKYR